MIELARTVTIGQYVGNRSAINRLDPRVKIVGAVLLIAAVSIVGSFTAFAICLVIALLILALSQLSVRFIASSLRPAVIFMLFIFPIEVLFYQFPQGTHPTIYWHWWALSISREGLLFSALISLRVLFLYYFVNMLTFTTSLVDLADGSESLLSPLQRLGLPINEVVMVMVVALKFVPIFVAELERLIKAQTARGVRLDTGNFISRAFKIGPLLVPLFLNGFKRAENLTVAMEARGYRGGKGRTKRRVLRLGWRDYLALPLLLLFCAAAFYVNYDPSYYAHLSGVWVELMHGLGA
jgi:energy-coupling factor transport system permease protein